MDRALILEKFPFYRDVNPGLRSEIASSVVETHLPRGTHFYVEGSRCEGFALVGLGRLRVYRLTETGREITLYEAQEGETCIVAMLSTILDMPAAANAVAQTDAEVLLVGPDTFRRWIREIEPVRGFAFRALAQGMVNMMTLVEDVAFRRTDRRLATFLLEQFSREKPSDDTLEVTHQDIAAELGSAREAISRVLEGFERLGAVTLARGRVTLKDPAILLRIAEESV